MTTTEHADAIQRNVDDFYADRIAYNEFGQRNRRLWDLIIADGLQEAVSDELRRRERAA